MLSIDHPPIVDLIFIGIVHSATVVGRGGTGINLMIRNVLATGSMPKPYYLSVVQFVCAEQSSQNIDSCRLDE
jgi:hypothetical protein